MLEVKIKQSIPYCEDFPIVCHKDFLYTYSSEYGYICGYSNNKLKCFIPFTIKHKWIFHYLEMKCETVILDSDVDEKEFLTQVIKYLKLHTRYDFVSQPPTNTLFNNYPQGSIFAPFGSYRIDLTMEEEQLWQQIHSKHKNVIRRALKEGVEVSIGAIFFDEVYSNIEETLTRNNMTMLPKKQLLQMLKNMPEHMLIGCSYLDNKIQSSAIILYSQHRGYYMWGGTSQDISLGANNLLHWEIIKALNNKGVKSYDFVGGRIDPPKNSRLEGIQRFKSRFGATMYHGFLWKYPLKLWKFKLFYRLIKFKQKNGDIIDQEKDTAHF